MAAIGIAPSPCVEFLQGLNPADHAIIEAAWPWCDHGQPGASIHYII